MIDTVVIVSSGQKRASAIHSHVSILPKSSLPSRLPHEIEQFPVIFRRSLLVTHFKYSTVYMSIPNFLTVPSLLHFHPANHKFIL